MVMARSLGRLRLERAVRIGTFVGSFAMKLDRFNRPIARRNLEIAFPDMSADARMDILRRMYRNWGRMAAEWTHMPQLTPGNIARYVSYDGREHWTRVEQLYPNRGALVVTAHFGNFELLPVTHALYGHPIAIIHRPLRNPRLDDAVRAARTVHGNLAIARKGAARQIFKLLSENWHVGLPIDLDVRRGVFVDFFGLKASTTDGLARLAMATGAPVVPAFIVREAESTCHRIVILPQVELAKGDDRETVLENTQRFTSVIEMMIRRHPDHWNWVHRRWKTRPPGEARFY